MANTPPAQPAAATPAVPLSGAPYMGPTSLTPYVAKEVVTPSGQKIKVIGDDEEEFYNSERKKYLDGNSFTNNSDLLDLDRLLFMELLAYRNSCWLGQGQDYDGKIVDIQRCERTLKEANNQISAIKNDLGISKSARDKAQAESVGAYIADLKERAKEFGIHREKQLAKGITLCQQLFSIVGAFDRADKVERGKLGFETEEDIVRWIRDTMRPEFDAVDEYFRKNQQKYWVRKI